MDSQQYLFQNIDHVTALTASRLHGGNKQGTLREKKILTIQMFTPYSLATWWESSAVMKKCGAGNGRK